MSPFGGDAVEGAFVLRPGFDRNFGVFTTMPADPGALVCGAGGCALGRFGWAHADGRVTNVRDDAADRIGFTIPPYASPALNTWQRNFWDCDTKTLRAREGTEIALLTRGAVWASFAAGAWPGQRVYASLVDGQAFSGYADDAELTLWSVLSVAGPGELAIISTSAYFGE
jgi:hypothetical protein